MAWAYVCYVIMHSSEHFVQPYRIPKQEYSFLCESVQMFQSLQRPSHWATNTLTIINIDSLPFRSG